jgi:hypothetical protein
MAWGDENDFGFSRFGQGGFTGGAQKHDMAADPTFAGDFGASQMGSASSADIADLLEAAADAGVDPSTNWAGGFNPELDQHWGVLGPSPVPNAVAVNQQGDRLNNAQVQALINLQSQTEMQSPGYPSQNYSDFGSAGINTFGQGNVSRGLNYANAMEVDARRQELMGELDRLNTLSVQASNVTQPYPSSWSQPDEWGMENVRIGGPAMAESRLGAPMSPLGPDTTRSAFPSPLTSVADYPAGDDWGMQDVRLDPLNPSPLTSVADYPGGDDWGMPNVGLTQASIAEGVMGPPGTYSQYLGDRARDASLAFDEYDRPSRQQQGVAASVAASPFDAGVMPGGGRYEPSVFDDYQPEEWVGQDSELGPVPTHDPNLALQEDQAWATVNDPDVDDYIEGKITAKELMGIKSEADLEKVVKKEVVEKSKRLTKEEKKANVAARRKAEEDYVAFRDELNFRVEIARSALATAENTHGKKSDEAKAAKRNVRNKEADLRMWERSDLYIKSYGSVKRTGMGQNLPLVGTALKVFTGIEDYFHSLGKTERRAAKDVLQDMKDNPEKYERVGAEVSAAQLVRNMYSFLRKAPMDVAAAAAREPAYLRYLINLNVNKQPIPTSYSSNWKNDISDAWIYG